MGTHWFYLKQAGLFKYSIVVLAVISASVIFSIFDESWEHVSRCGGLITVFGASLLGRDLIRKGPYSANEEKPPLATRVGNVNKFNPEGMYADINEKIDNYAKYIGLYILIVGTLLWSYGDYVLNMVWRYGI
jgi:hypothetical protein